MAGLLAARVLTRHFERVTVIDRDHLPADAAPRRGTPQAHHLHVLLMRGRQILEEMFPGIVEDEVRRGCRVVDMADDVRWMTPAGLGVRYQSDLQILVSSRWLLESIVRNHLRGNDRIALIDRCEMLGLHLDRTATAVDGVREHGQWLLSLMHRYMDRVIALTTHNVAVRDTMLRAFHMLTPLTTLFRPHVALRMLWQGQPAQRNLRNDAAQPERAVSTN